MKENHDASTKATLVIVRGRVQGVGFRYDARMIARSLGLVGWVANLSDGGVETYAEGTELAINKYMQWLQHGPPGARVDSLDITERQGTGKYSSFSIE